MASLLQQSSIDPKTSLIEEHVIRSIDSSTPTPH